MSRHMQAATALALVLILACAALAGMAQKFGPYTSENATEPLTVSLEQFEDYNRFLVRAWGNGSPTAGSLAVSADGYNDSSQDLDLTKVDQLLYLAPARTFAFTPSGFDGDDFSVEIKAWRE